MTFFGVFAAMPSVKRQTEEGSGPRCSSKCTPKFNSRQNWGSMAPNKICGGQALHSVTLSLQRTFVLRSKSKLPIRCFEVGHIINPANAMTLPRRHHGTLALVIQVILPLECVQSLAKFHLSQGPSGVALCSLSTDFKLLCFLNGG